MPDSTSTSRGSLGGFNLEQLENYIEPHYLLCTISLCNLRETSDLQRVSEKGNDKNIETEFLVERDAGQFETRPWTHALGSAVDPMTGSNPSSST